MHAPQLIYKICTKVNNSIKSIYFNYDITNPYLVTYKLNQYVEAKPEFAELGYHLLAFPYDKEKINLFMSQFTYTYYVIYKAFGVDQILKLPPPVLTNTQLNINGIKFAKHSLYAKWPEGTLMFKKIMLLEEVSL